MTTPEEPRHVAFAKDAGKRAALAKALSNQTLREAIEIVLEQIEPETGTQADALPAVAAAKYHQVAGANDLLKKLRKLTVEPKEVKVPRVKNIARTIEDLPPANS